MTQHMCCSTTAQDQSLKQQQKTIAKTTKLAFTRQRGFTKTRQVRLHIEWHSRSAFTSNGTVCTRKTKCPNQAQNVLNCWNQNCEGAIHASCSKSKLNCFCIKPKDRPDNPTVVFCKKGCCAIWKSEKKKKERKRAGKACQRAEQEKVQGSVGAGWFLESFVGLVDNRRELCCSCGSQQKNKGTPKSAYHKQIAEFVQSKVPASQRDAIDVENKINSLESQFRKDSDWKNNTGAGLDDPGSIEKGILDRCAHCNELEPIMGDRPNAKPLATSEDFDFNLDSDDNSGTSGQTAVEAVAASAAEPAESTEQPVQVAKERLASTAKKKQRSSGKAKADDIVSFLFGDEVEEMKSLREREVKAREQEVEMNNQKVKAETDLINIKKIATLLKERKELLDSGACSEEQLDEFLSLPKNNN